MSNISSELEYLIRQVFESEKAIENTLTSFKKYYKNCDWARTWQGQGLSIPNYPKELCKRGTSYLTNYVINPLLLSLSNYKDLIEKKQAYTQGGTIILLKGLLSNIHRYSVIVYFLVKNKYLEKEKSKMIEDIRRLMGCRNSVLRFQKLDNVMKGDHEKILKYINKQCSFLRTELLK